MQRVVTGLVLLVLLWGAVVHAPPMLFVALAALAISLASWECYRMLEHYGGRPFKWIGILANLAVVWSFSGRSPEFGVELPFVAAMILTLGLAMARRAEPRAMLDAARGTLFPVAFVGLPLAYLVALRDLPGVPHGSLLWMLFVVVILGDTGAFYVGTKLGRHHLAPTISPKKTWEGAAGGVVAGLAGALLVRTVFVPELALYHAVILGLLLALAGILGDLSESLVKRATGFKDSSRLLPGHGGILDRADSLLFSGPILYYYWEVFLQGRL